MRRPDHRAISSYHDAERAEELGLRCHRRAARRLRVVGLRRWTETLRAELAGSEVDGGAEREWRSPWTSAGGERRPSGAGAAPGDEAPALPVAGATADAGQIADATQGTPRLRVRIDGGSRGNPGPSAIGVVLEDRRGPGARHASAE